MPRSLLRRVASAALVSLLGLLLLEGLARVGLRLGAQVLLPPEVRSWIGAQEVVFDPELGWRRADMSARVEGGHFVRDSFQRDGRPRRPGELRGYAFGDSQTHGAGVAEHAAWPSATEVALREAGLDVEVVNLGSSGSRSAQVLRLMEAYVLPRDPDFLVVDCMANDSRPLPRDYGRQGSRARALLFESRLYRLLRLGVGAARGENLGPRSAVRIEQPPTPEHGLGNHHAIAQLARSRGIPLVFVDYPFMGNPVKSLASRERLPPGSVVAPATEALRQSGKPPETLFLENNHLTVEGGSIVGKAVAATLLPLLREASGAQAP
jgi:hypothetical protein